MKTDDKKQENNADKRIREIRELEIRLEKEGENEDLLLRLGELYHAVGDMRQALNKFNAVLKINPANKRARTYVIMINNVFDFFYPDLINP